MLKGFIRSCCVLVLTAFPFAVMAQSCQSVVITDAMLQSWSNPKPESDDYILPLPGGIGIAFKPIPLAYKGFFGGEKSIYTMGSTQSVRPFPFETPLEVRVASPMSNARDDTMLLIGKYELSKGQFVFIAGGGDMEKGLGELMARSRDTNVQQLVGPYFKAGDPCQKKLTRDIVRLLSEPLTFLAATDYARVLETLNLACLQRANCRERLVSLSRNPDYPAFVRLPTEHEWEFTARGGGEFAAGRMSKAAMQADLPSLPSGKSIGDYAQLNNDPPRFTSIGSRESLFGLYDVFGGAEELMQTPFTTENGFGAVGGLVARGGYYGLRPDEIRVSRRIELPIYRRDDVSGAFELQYFPNAGIRPVIGLPIIGSTERTGSGELAAQFNTDYKPVGEAGDAGDTMNNAKDLGRLTAKERLSSGELSRQRSVGYLMVLLDEFASLEIGANAAVPMRVTVTTEVEETVAVATTSGSPPLLKLATKPLVPGRYFIRVSYDDLAATNRYKLFVAKKTVPDTGIPRPDAAALAAAPAVRSSSGLRYEGYVGTDDRTDTYPFLLDDAAGGVVAKISAFSGSLTLIYLDDKQRVVAKQTSDPKQSELVLPIPVDRGTRGFVQVVAEPGALTTYALNLSAGRLGSAEFIARTIDPVSTYAVANRTYEGFLSSTRDSLILPVRISASELRVELTGMTADVDLDVLDSAGRALESSHRRSGNDPEFFSKSVDAGTYFLRATMKAPPGTTTPFKLRYSTGMASAAAAPVLLTPSEARAKAQSLGTLYGSSVRRDVSGTGIREYFKIETVRRGTVTAGISGFQSGSDLDLFLEDAWGDPVAKSANSGRASEQIKQVLEPGTYFLRVEPVGNYLKTNYAITVDITFEAEALMLEVCNTSKMRASVSVMGVPQGQTDFHAEGWWEVKPKSCTNIQRYKRDGIYVYAKQYKGSAEWRGTDRKYCVEFPGPFDRINTPGYTCKGSELKGFRRLNLDGASDKVTWTLNP